MKQVRFLWWAACLMLCAALVPVHTAKAQSAVAGWRDTGVVLPGIVQASQLCIDSTQPNTVLVNEEGVGTVAYNWSTGQRTVLNSRPYLLCGVNGWLYAADAAGGWRFSLADPAGTAVSRLPSVLAKDGSLMAYAVDMRGVAVSSDGGLAWAVRPLPVAGFAEYLAVPSADGGALYALAVDRSVAPVRYSVLFSPDAGASWEVRSTGESASAGAGYPSFSFETIPGRAPVSALLLAVRNGSGSGSPPKVQLSIDGGRSFTQLPASLDTGAVVVSSNEGLVTQSYVSRSYSLSVTPYGRSPAFALPRPPLPEAGYGYAPRLLAVEAAPANLLITDQGDAGLWHSPDNGRTWNQLATEGRSGIAISPYLPLTLLSVKDNRLYAIELPDAGARQTLPEGPRGIAGGEFYSLTGQTTSPLFQTYWQRTGGLALYGYPRTMPFREINPADNKIYTVQYFERNRFEYHPELRGTPYEVLLGLLGNQLTEGRRSEAPFLPVANPNQSGVRYFAETGHTLDGAFLSYWSARGGLATYGYPISQPFEEQNPDDGKIYTVQYFERNRFEYHPELAGTQYEVLLGLLGNSVLRDKGWLE